MRCTYLFRFLVMVLVVVLTACNDESKFSGANSDKATITDTNAQAIAIATTDGVSAAYSYQELNEIITALRVSIETRSSDTIAGTCATSSGTLAMPAGLAQTGTISGTLAFNNFCLAGGSLTGDVIFDGDADFEIIYDQSSQITKLSLQVTNVALTEGGYTVLLNGSISQESDQLSTTLTTDYIGSDGRQYQATNLYKSGSYSVGYTIDSGTISDPDYGAVDIYTKSQAPMLYNNCSNGKPISGSLVVTGSSSDAMQIDYDGCSQYIVYLNANATGDIYSW